MGSNGDLINEELPGTFDQLEEYGINEMAMEIGANVIDVPVVSEEKQRLDLLEGRTSDWFTTFDERVGSLEDRISNATLSGWETSNEVAGLKGQFSDVKSILTEHVKKMSEEMTSLHKAINAGAFAGANVIEETNTRVQEPKMYTGSRDAREVENFLYDAEAYFEANGIKGEEMPTLVGTYLGGDAKIWWRTMLQEEEAAGFSKPLSWDDIKEGLRGQFWPSNDAWYARESLRRLTMTDTPQAYADSFSAWVQQVRGMSEEDQMFQFMAGARAWVNAELRICKVQRIGEAIDVVRNLADYEPATDSRGSGSKGKSKAKSDDSSRYDEPADEMPFPTSRKYKGCFICKGMHFAKSCPLKAKLVEPSRDDHGGHSSKTRDEQSEGARKRPRSEVASRFDRRRD